MHLAAQAAVVVAAAAAVAVIAAVPISEELCVQFYLQLMLAVEEVDASSTEQREKKA
jgi:hypothetical protein